MASLLKMWLLVVLTTKIMWRFTLVLPGKVLVIYSVDQMENICHWHWLWFGDKTHTNLHGTLSGTPILFSLALVNRAARNNPSFWRLLPYIPNLSHGKGKVDCTESIDKNMNEHKCLALAFQLLVEMNKSDSGLKMSVKGCCVSGRAWIYFFVGKT